MIEDARNYSQYYSFVSLSFSAKHLRNVEKSKSIPSSLTSLESTNNFMRTCTSEMHSTSFFGSKNIGTSYLFVTHFLSLMPASPIAFPENEISPSASSAVGRLRVKASTSKLSIKDFNMTLLSSLCASSRHLCR